MSLLHDPFEQFPISDINSLAEALYSTRISSNRETRETKIDYQDFNNCGIGSWINRIWENLRVIGGWRYQLWLRL
jgi:hypothetical protein